MRETFRLFLAAAILGGGTAAAFAQSGGDGVRQLPAELFVRGEDSGLAGALTPRERAFNWSAAAPQNREAEPRSFTARASTFLARNRAGLGLDDNAGVFEVESERISLGSRVVRFRQMFNDIPVHGSDVTVVLTDDGDVDSVSRNVVVVPGAADAALATEPAISERQALEIVWADLGPQGELLQEPVSSLEYHVGDGDLTLAYFIEIAVAQPSGSWLYVIDAENGSIIERRDRRIQENKRELSPTARLANPAAATGSVLDLDEALRNFAADARATRLYRAEGAKPGTATALIFDPDPVTRLKNANLADNSPASSFNDAYVSVTLNDVTMINGAYHLSGPTVRIEDFEEGEDWRSMAPSTSEGSWTATRGDNAFNDVMTYYHLGNSIAYVRSLGFRDNLELFPDGIAADSDAAEGDDNSYYDINLNRLAFGHGCVDDNEDVDVILHELGHAITHNLNPDWYGGDSGAIGEGFGDYWAATYSIRASSDGLDPAKVFTWDGIESCWPGRRADRLNARYDEDTEYWAHERYDGFVSDELWATPLFQSYLELTAMGELPETVDQVVLLGMRNVGSGFTMRTLARQTVAAARQQYPNGPHEEVFIRNFQRHNILR